MCSSISRFRWSCKHSIVSVLLWSPPSLVCVFKSVSLIFLDVCLLFSHDWFLTICQRDAEPQNQISPHKLKKSFRIMTCRFWVSSASLWMLHASFPCCDIISVLTSAILFLMSCSVALGYQTSAVAVVVKPLTFWAKAKAEAISSLRRAGKESQQCSDVYLVYLVVVKGYREPQSPGGWMIKMTKVRQFPVKVSFRRKWSRCWLDVASCWLWSTTFTRGSTLQIIAIC